MAAERASRPSAEHEERLQAAQKRELEALAQLNDTTHSFQVRACPGAADSLHGAFVCHVCAADSQATLLRPLAPPGHTFARSPPDPALLCLPHQARVSELEQELADVQAKLLTVESRGESHEVLRLRSVR